MSCKDNIGTKVISEDLGIKLEDVTVDMLGQAQKVVSKEDSTIIVGGKGSRVAIKKELNRLKNRRRH